MFQHGFEEGFRRVRQDSPSIADQLERYLSETQRPPELQRKPKDLRHQSHQNQHHLKLKHHNEKTDIWRCHSTFHLTKTEIFCLI